MMEFVSGFVIGICFTVGTIILLAGWAKRKNLEAKRRLEENKYYNKKRENSTGIIRIN